MSLKLSWEKWTNYRVLSLFFTCSGGSTTTGNLSVRYLGPKKRDKIVALYHFDTDDEKHDFWFLLQALNVIIRIINSWREKVDLEKFGPYVRETQMKMHDMFPEIWDNGKIITIIFHQNFFLPIVICLCPHKYMYIVLIWICLYYRNCTWAPWPWWESYQRQQRCEIYVFSPLAPSKREKNIPVFFLS